MNNLEEELIWLRVQNASLAQQMRRAKEDYTRSDNELDERLKRLEKEKTMEEYLKAVFELELEIEIALAEYNATDEVKYIYEANRCTLKLADVRSTYYNS